MDQGKLAKQFYAGFKARKAQKAYAILKKRAKQRYFICKEIFDSETVYLRDIQIVYQHIMLPCQEQKLISEQDFKTIFVNLDEIVKINTLYHESLQESFANYSHWKKIFSQNFMLIDQFIVYVPYCNGYNQSEKLLKDILKSNQAFADHIQSLRQQNIIGKQQIDSFMIKPFQRITKYPLLFKELLKNTDHEHPDYDAIAQSLDKFQKVNAENEKNMSINVKRLKAKDILNQLEVNIPDPEYDRIYRSEDAHHLIWNEVDIPVVVYYFTDVLIIVRHEDNGQNKFLKAIFIDEMSFVKDQADSKYFQNRFSVVGKTDTVQFVSQERSDKKTTIKLLEQLFEEYRELIRSNHAKDKDFQIRYPVQVSVVGTEERNYQSFNKHTVYITEVRIHKIVLKIFVRFSEIAKKSEFYRVSFPNLQFPSFNTKEWLNNQKTKIIERRMQLIELFLQTILQSEECKALRPRILQEFNLPKNFYDLPEIIKQEQFFTNPQQTIGVSQIAFQSVNSLRDSLSKLGLKQDATKIKLSAGEILNAYQKASVFQDTIHISTVEKFLKIQEEKKDQREVFLMNEEKVLVKISPQTRAADIVEEIARKKNLLYYEDFRIYLIDTLGNARVIDGDEIISEVLEESLAEQNGMFQKIVGKVETVFFAVKKQQIRLEMRKYLQLQFEKEEFDIKRDTVRLELVANQILQEVWKQHYYITFKEYCHFLALHFISKQQKIDIKQIKKILPIDILKTAQHKSWIQTTQDIYIAIEEELKKIKDQRLMASQSLQNSNNEAAKEDQILSQRVILNSIKPNHLYGIAMYYVELSLKMQKTFKDELRIAVYPNIYIGITYSKFYFLTPSRKEVFKTYQLQEVGEIKSFPSQIVFTLKNSDVLFKFTTYQSYEIKMIMNDYLKLKQFNDDFDIGMKY